MTAMTVQRPGALGILALEEAEAWRDYLETTTEAGPVRYEEVEPWAWNQLGLKLRAIQARRVVLEQPVNE